MATSEIKTSIIVPVYNAAPFLPEALDSFLAQTLKGIEIICVDDGSTDNSAAILKKYAQKDKRLKIFSQANSGAAVARNKGIEKARGKWLSFLDADDLAHPEMIEKMYDRGEETGCDVVVCRANFLLPDKTTTPLDCAFVDQLIPENEPFTLRQAGTFMFTNPSVWNKLYRREFIVAKNLRFQNLSSCNDVAFGMLALAEAGKISTVAEALYDYRTEIAGNITASRGKHAQNILLAAQYVRDELKKRGLFSSLTNAFYRRTAVSFAYEYGLVRGYNAKRRLYEQFRRFLPKSFIKEQIAKPHWWDWLYKKQKSGNKRVLRILGIKICYRKKKKRQSVASRKNDIHFRGFNQMAYCIRSNLHKLPENIDLIVGVPRSGIIPAYMTALFLNKPVCSLNEFLHGIPPAHGNRPQKKASIRRVLVVDDSVYSGSALKKTKEALQPLAGKYEFIYLCIYSSDQANPKPDIFFENVPVPRLFQWNYLNHGIAERACFDIDGVLCFDPTEEENDDGEKYRRFILNARPLYIPNYKIRALVTSRLEKYRPETESWLKKNGVKYDKLYMLDLASKEERMKLGCHADFKAKIYKKLDDCILFVESNPKQAGRIAEISGKPAICVETDEMFGRFVD